MALVFAVLTVVAGAMPAPAAAAAAPAPRLLLHVLASPSVGFSPLDSEECFSGEKSKPTEFDEAQPCDEYGVAVTNVGAQASSGPVVITDQLPAGLRVGTAMLTHLVPEEGMEEFQECELLDSKHEVRCEGPQLAPDERLELDIRPRLETGAASGAVNLAEVSEGASTVAREETPDVINAGDERAAFGATGLLALISTEAGLADTQAGAHPYELLNEFDLATDMGRGAETARLTPTDTGGGVRDVVVELPLGFVGSAQATPKCTLAKLQSVEGCPKDTEIGSILSEPTSAIDVASPVYNLLPERGLAAQLGFFDSLKGTHVVDVSLAPTPSGYVLRATARETPYLLLWDVITTIWGDPAARNGGGGTPAAMFTNSSDCDGQPQRSTVYLDDWVHPGAFYPDGQPDVQGEGWASASSESPPVTGCEKLSFEPEAFSFQLETQTADTPTGATFDLQVPHGESPGTSATPPLKAATVTLPPGLSVDPARAGGLEGCSEAQIGWLGPVSTSNPGYTNFTEAAPTCPEGSRVASLEVTSPLIEGTLQGSLYIANQFENPYNTLVGGYVVIDDPQTGTIVKVPGELRLNQETGQITGIFNDNPQIPLSELKIHFFGGARGDLATPEACGTYTTQGEFEPWSAPASGPNAVKDSSFKLNSGCVSAFTPFFHAGTSSNQAGGYSPFTLSFGREDDEQGLGGLTVTLPEGLTGKIAGITECSEAQVQAAEARSHPGEGAAELASPSCPAASQLGTVTTESGPGSEPYTVTGKAYLTGPYKGAPYGLAVIVPAVAGPFDLGVVVIRQALYINPTTAQVTDVSDPFPTIRDGIPLRIQRVQVELNREDFTLNATSCEAKSITGTATSTAGTQTAVSARYQAAGCASLPFSPTFTASTDGHTSKADGASLNVKISFSSGQANIHKVELEIPKVLPSRLSTLQKACTEAQFNANPAGCPSASLIATAIARTPLLPEPLSGPVYFVSHGNEAFPDTVMVLQGDNVKLEVTGHTQIKNGATFSRFETVPDAPVSSFEFKAPEGPYSIFGANANLCDTEVRLPTTITAQNGAVLKQDTLVAPEGCPNTLTILSHNIRKRTITLKIAVPAAGKLTASGKGLTTTSKSSSARTTLTLALNAKGHRKLTTKIKLTFAPATGAGLSQTLSASFNRQPGKATKASSKHRHRSR
ncbi:MAG TPA: hypothetical protein VMB51_00910 [Solirubrobacteraceae bacterium]|nr:hypothetical protein [Solirubrobacteraceae bacterium]